MIKIYLSVCAFLCIYQNGFAQDSLQILFPGQYHDDEVDNNDVKKQWIGLFFNNENYYLAKTTIAISKIDDPVSDEDSLHPSGDFITVAGSDQCILLLSGSSFKERENIDHIDVQHNQLSPGEFIEFGYNDLKYKIYAEGDAYDETTGWLNGAYRLYIRETNRLFHNQLISSDSMYSESPYSILWVGDLDGDKEIDLLINLSANYNLSLPTLFLSGGKRKGELMKKSAQLASVGC